jgi:glyoxylase-like metal-dependent hydrolase (beta-lactamase superfamily II)
MACARARRRSDTSMGLRSIAADIAILSERPVIAVCTHSHHDHAGGLCQFEKRLGHPAEAEIFANPTRSTVVAELLDTSVIQKMPYEGFDAGRWCYDPAPLTKQVDEGDVLTLGIASCAWSTSLATLRDR